MDPSGQSPERPGAEPTRRAMMWVVGLTLIAWLVVTAVGQLVGFTGYGIGVPIPPTFPFDIMTVLVLLGLVVAHTGRVWPLVGLVLLGGVVQFQDARNTGDVSDWLGLALLVAVAVAALSYRAERRRAEALPRLTW